MAVRWELLGGALSGHRLLLGEVARRDALGQREGIGVIAARGQAAHGQCEKHDRQPDGRDQDEQNRDQSLAIGSADQLDALKRELQRGPRMARVEQVTESDAEILSEFSRGFTIEHDN